MQTQTQPERVPVVLDRVLRALAVLHGLAGVVLAAFLSFLFVALTESHDDHVAFVTWVCFLGLGYLVLCCLAAFSRQPLRRLWCGVAVAAVAILALSSILADAGVLVFAWLAPSLALLGCAVRALVAQYLP